MKIIAIVLNILLLISVVMLTANEGIPSTEDAWFFAWIFMVVTPIFTLFTFSFMGLGSWLDLYFKRKAAEERKRIAELEK